MKTLSAPVYLLYHLLSKVLLPIVLVATQCAVCYAQKSTNEQASTALDFLSDVTIIVDGIENGNCVQSPHVGQGFVGEEFAAPTASQWIKYEQLKKAASVEQLVLLTDHKNSAVRCYAFQAIASKYPDRVFNILLNHLHDTAYVDAHMGCLILANRVGDYFIYTVTTDFFEKETYKLNDKERNILDSILLFDPLIKLDTKSLLLRKFIPTEQKYKRIRQLVEQERNLYALKPLAMYRNQADKELIASFLEDEFTQPTALHVVKDYPDDYYYPFILKIIDKEWTNDTYFYHKLKVCYQILAKYPSRQETIDFFNSTLKIKDKDKYQILCKYLLVAITKYPNDIYKPIKDKIKLNESTMRGFNAELNEDCCW